MGSNGPEVFSCLPEDSESWMRAHNWPGPESKGVGMRNVHLQCSLAPVMMAEDHTKGFSPKENGFCEASTYPCPTAVTELGGGTEGKQVSGSGCKASPASKPKSTCEILSSLQTAALSKTAEMKERAVCGGLRVCDVIRDCQV